MSGTSPLSNKETMPHIQLRIDLVDGQFKLEDKVLATMSKFRAACASFANELETIRKDADVDYDIGRWTAVMDTVQDVKDRSCAALILQAEANNRKRAKFGNVDADDATTEE